MNVLKPCRSGTCKGTARTSWVDRTKKALPLGARSFAEQLMTYTEHQSETGELPPTPRVWVVEGGSPYSSQFESGLLSTHDLISTYHRPGTHQMDPGFSPLSLPKPSRLCCLKHVLSILWPWLSWNYIPHAGFKITEIHLLLSPSAGIKGATTIPGPKTGCLMKPNLEKPTRTSGNFCSQVISIL